MSVQNAPKVKVIQSHDMKEIYEEKSFGPIKWWKLVERSDTGQSIYIVSDIEIKNIYYNNEKIK